jgi:prepilin-type N-terminal cleavage/methylation domain-containing protein
MAARARPSCQAGFTLVEVMVAMLILLVGVLGVVTMVDGANAVTSKTKAREGGNALVRSVIEVSRSIRYRDLTTAVLEDALNTRPGLADSKPATPGYTFESRGVEYRMTLSVCSLDDLKDGLGTQPPGVAFCADSDVLPVGGVAQDRNPDDYKRVRVKLVWKTRGSEASVTQTSSIINPVGGLGPSVTGLAMTSPGSSSATQVRIDSNVASAQFTAVTSTFAAELNWSVNGDSQGKANGGPTNWTFQWNFVNGSEILYYDCNYFIQADAFDNEGRAGAPRVLSVIVNRIPPVAPTNFVGGRNGSGDRVDLRWNPNPECDVIGYRVFRSADPASTGTAINCNLGAPDPTLTTNVSCVDEAAPPGPLYYRVVGVDSDQTGNPRNGTVSAQLTVPATGSNSLPSTPANLTTCTGGQPGCNGPDGEPAPSGQIVIRWDASTDSDGTIASYRIYRNGTTYADRWDDFFPEAGGVLAWLEYDDEGAPHTYRVTAVDDLFGESGLSAPITAP